MLPPSNTHRQAKRAEGRFNINNCFLNSLEEKFVLDSLRRRRVSIRFRLSMSYMDYIPERQGI